MNLSLVPRAVTVLLGATQASKTTLMRLMAGLDKPSEGTVRVDGVDVTGVPVRQRNVAMVVPAVHQLPVDDRVRQHRLAAEAARRGWHRRPRAFARRPAAHRAVPAAPALRTLRRPAAAESSAAGAGNGSMCSRAASELGRRTPGHGFGGVLVRRAPCGAVPRSAYLRRVGASARGVRRNAHEPRRPAPGAPKRRLRLLSSPRPMTCRRAAWRRRRKKLASHA